MAERPFEPVPNTPLVADPTGDAIWKRWLQNLQRFLGNAVRGPGSSTDNAVARWDGTSGQFLNNSGVIIDDSNNVSGIANLSASGTLTITSGNITTNGFTAISLQTSGGTQVKIANNTANDFITLQGSTGDVLVFPDGSSSNVTFNLYSKGNSPVKIYTNATAPVEQLRVNHTNNANRHVEITGSNGGNPSIGASAGNLAVSSDLTLNTGVITTQSVTALSFATTGGIHLKTPNATAVDFTNIQGGTGDVLFFPDGSSSNVNLNIYSKGTGSIKFYTNAAAPFQQVTILDTANATRQVTITGSNGGNPTIGTSAGNLAITPILAAQNKIYPGTDAAAFQTAAGIYAGTGAPNNANGNDGDFYFRSDGGVLTTIYHKRAGAWVGVV